jgi:hypothetical protein
LFFCERDSSGTTEAGNAREGDGADSPTQAAVGGEAARPNHCLCASAEDKAALESNAIFNEVQKLAIEQGDKNFVKRWKENKETGAKFKAIILSGDSKNPQLATVTRFAADMVKEGKTIATRDASKMEKEQKAALEALQLQYTTMCQKSLKTSYLYSKKLDKILFANTFISIHI